MPIRRPHLSQVALDGEEFAETIIAYVERLGGEYVRMHDGSLAIVVGDKRIPINQHRDNRALWGLVLQACNVSPVSLATRSAIHRVEQHADKNAGRLQMRTFSA